MPCAAFDDRNVLNTKEAAAHCRVSCSTLEKLRVAGNGPVFIKPTRRVVYRLSDLDAWLDAYRRTSTSDNGTYIAGQKR